jgi:hypothetical protein
MFAYINELGETDDSNDVDRGVITTRVGYSSAESRKMFDQIYPKIYKEYYNTVVQKYLDAGYSPQRGRGTPESAISQVMKGMSYIPYIGTILGMFGGMFGGQARPSVPYREIRHMAASYAKNETEKLIKEKDKEMKTTLVEHEEASRWAGIQASRGQSSMLMTPQNVTVNKGRLVSQVRGGTVVTPTK